MTSLTAQGFMNWDTGGGCTAWTKKLPTGQYLVLTHNNPFENYPYSNALIGIYDGAESGSTLWGELIGECELDFNTQEAP